MRVLQAVQALPPHTYGGSELYTAAVSEALDERGHDVAAAAPRGGDAVDVPTFDLPAPDAPGVQDDRGLPTGPVDPAVEERFDEVLAAFEPDVVHLQHLKGLSATIPARCSARGVGCVLTLHDFWAICHREQLYRPDGRRCSGPESVDKCTDCYLADAEARAGAVNAEPRADETDAEPRADETDAEPRADETDAEPRTDETSATRGSERAAGRSDASRVRLDGSRSPSEADLDTDRDPAREQYRAVVRQRERLLSAALERTDLLVSPSSFLRDVFVRYGTPAEDIVQSRNGIRVDRFEDTGFDGAPVRVGYAGRIAPEKGVHLLVSAFDRLDGDATLDVFGRFEPAERPYHARLADRAGDDVRFRGRYDDPAAPYRELDLFVLPSVWDENSPLVVQEAHASGVPVVASDVGGMAELVTDGVDGLTFPVEDVGALAERLSRVVADPARLERLRSGVEAPRRLAEHVSELESLYADRASP